MVLQKKPAVLLALGAALLFVGGGALTFWTVGRRSTWTKAMPAGAKAIPDQAVMVLALSTDEGQWRRLRQFGTPATQAQFDQVLVQWRDRLFTEAGINFAQDLQPWVGPEITLAVLPTDGANPATSSPLNTPGLALESNLVAVVPIGSVGAAQEGLGNRLAEAKEVGDNPYRGITIQEIEVAEREPLYAAVLNPELAIVSPQVALLKQSIDTFRGDASVLDNEGFSKAFEQLGESRSLGRFYVDVPAAVQAFANTADPPIPASRLEPLQAPRTLAGTLAVTNQGVTIQAISSLAEGPQVFNTSNKADQMTQRLPADTLIMLSTGDFQQFWEDFKTGKQLSALFPIRPEEISLGLQSSTGLVLEEDLLPWMGGEFALGILSPPNRPTDQEGVPLPTPALVLMVKTNNRDAATATLSRLDEVMANRYRYTVETVDSGGLETVQWTAPFDSLTMHHGWLEGDVLFLSLGNGVANLIAPRPSRALGASSLFQATTGEAPRPNNGHFFINLKDMASAEDNLLLPPVPTDGLLSAEALEAIGVTATVLSDRQVRYDITTVLKRGNRPGALSAADPETPATPAEPQATPSTPTTPE